MITIDKNKELDYEVYTNFYDFSVEGADFGGTIKKDHPNINLENYKKYIDDFYVVNESEMSLKQQQINNLIKEKRSKFYIALKKVFGIDFNNQKCCGYLSIFNCNPRWPETKTFQIYYKKDLPHMLEVAFHESLHFVFFDYCDKFLSKEAKGMDKNTGVLWELSEIVNVMILNLPEFREILGMEEKLFYPGLQEKLEKAKEIWKSSNDIKKFVAEYLNVFR